MQSQSGLSEFALKERVQQLANDKWEGLTDGQRKLARKAWGVMTYKWRWQIAMNIPYLVMFTLDRTIPAVHQFDMAVLASITAKLPIPSFISSFIGLS